MHRAESGPFGDDSFHGPSASSKHLKHSPSGALIDAIDAQVSAPPLGRPPRGPASVLLPAAAAPAAAASAAAAALAESTDSLALALKAVVKIFTTVAKCVAVAPSSGGLRSSRARAQPPPPPPALRAPPPPPRPRAPRACAAFQLPPTG